jgi:hypothetical protein
MSDLGYIETVHYIRLGVSLVFTAVLIAAAVRTRFWAAWIAAGMLTAQHLLGLYQRLLAEPVSVATGTCVSESEPNVLKPCPVPDGVVMDSWINLTTPVLGLLATAATAYFMWVYFVRRDPETPNNKLQRTRGGSFGEQ